MRKKITLIIILFHAFHVSAQTFEGKISYSNVYQSKSRTLPNYKLAELFGLNHTYFLKDGDYKLVANGTLLEWQIFRKAENKLVTKMTPIEKSETSELSDKYDQVKKVEVLRNSIKILNIDCDEFIVHCRRGTHKYYLDSRLNIQTKIFTDNEFNRWFAFFSKLGITPLKMIIETETDTCESTAQEISEESIDMNIFVVEK